MVTTVSRILEAWICVPRNKPDDKTGKWRGRKMSKIFSFPKAGGWKWERAPEEGETEAANSKQKIPEKPSECAENKWCVKLTRNNFGKCQTGNWYSHCQFQPLFFVVCFPSFLGWVCVLYYFYVCFIFFVGSRPEVGPRKADRQTKVPKPEANSFTSWLTLLLHECRFYCAERSSCFLFVDTVPAVNLVDVEVFVSFTTSSDLVSSFNLSFILICRDFNELYTFEFTQFIVQLNKVMKTFTL